MGLHSLVCMGKQEVCREYLRMTREALLQAKTEKLPSAGSLEAFLEKIRRTEAAQAVDTSDQPEA